MKKKYQSIRPLFLIIASLLFLLSLSARSADSLRNWSIGASLPISGKMVHATCYLFGKIASLPSTLRGKPQLVKEEELQKLRLENNQLHQRIHDLRELVANEGQLLAHQMALSENTSLPPSFSERWIRHKEELLKVFNYQMDALPARVTFRAPESWSNSLWLDVGDSDNEALGRPIIAKNSPVVLGSSLVGVVEYVGRYRSRVRLLTDAVLRPSVRAARKGALLAKGELHGSGAPLWRSCQSTLHGTGFCYNAPDEEGPARNLRTGQPIDAKGPPIPILQKGDLLITTGMDGIFPKGLDVAIVHSIHSLREGDYFYRLEATPTAGDFNTLSLLYVLPPLNPED